MKGSVSEKGLSAWLRRNRWTILVLVLAALLFVGVRLALREEPEETIQANDYAEFEKATVLSIRSDSTRSDPDSDGGWRGEQLLIVKVETGQYEGEQLLVYNDVNPLKSSPPAREGDSVTLIINTYGDGTVMATVNEYNRIPALLIVIGAFFLVTLLVGRRTGLKSLLSLALTVLCLFTVLIPLLLRGAPTLLTVFLVCAYITVVTFTILGGIQRKSLCAMLGTIAGTALAMLFGLLAQSLCRIDGLRIDDLEPLLQLRQTGTPLGLKHLLVAGIIISALGAVMDVAMSISSALEEVHAANRDLGFHALFRSGMNIGQDMVGTMTNTLILAFLGSGFTLILYYYTLGLAYYQLYPSSYLSIEVISGISSSIGMILAIPLTAAVCAVLLAKDRQEKAQSPASAKVKKRKSGEASEKTPSKLGKKG